MPATSIFLRFRILKNDYNFNRISIHVYLQKHEIPKKEILKRIRCQKKQPTELDVTGKLDGRSTSTEEAYQQKEHNINILRYFTALILEATILSRLKICEIFLSLLG